MLGLTWAQSPLKKHAVSPKASKTQCCDDVRALKVQVANLTSLLEELNKKQEADRITLVKQVMELEKLNQQQEARVTEAESKYSEINNRVDIMQFQAMQGAPQTTLGKKSNEKILILCKHSLNGLSACVSFYCINMPSGCQDSPGSELISAGCWHLLRLELFGYMEKNIAPQMFSQVDLKSWVYQLRLHAEKKLWRLLKRFAGFYQKTQFQTT